MAIVFTDRALFLPDGIPEAVGAAFVGPWTNEVGGGADAVLASGSHLVVDMAGLGYKAHDFASSSWLTWSPGTTYSYPIFRCVVLYDWTAFGVFDTPSGSIGTLLYSTGSSLSTIWAGTNLSASAGQSAMGAGKLSTVMDLFNGSASHHRVSFGGSDYLHTGNTATSGGRNGLTIGSRQAGNQKGNATVAAVLYSTVDLGGETDTATIRDAYVAHASSHLYPVFGTDVPGLSAPAGGDATAVFQAGTLTLSSGLVVPMADAGATLQAGVLSLVGGSLERIVDAIAALPPSKVEFVGQPLGVEVNALADLGAGLLLLSSAPLEVRVAAIAALGPGSLALSGATLVVSLGDLSPDRIHAALQITRRLEARLNINRRVSATLER